MNQELIHTHKFDRPLRAFIYRIKPNSAPYEINTVCNYNYEVRMNRIMDSK